MQFENLPPKGFTYVTNGLIARMIADDLTASEFKILLNIIFYVNTTDKKEHNFTIDGIMQECNIKTKNTLVKAIQGLEDKEYIKSYLKGNLYTISFGIYNS